MRVLWLICAFLLAFLVLSFGFQFWQDINREPPRVQLPHSQQVQIHQPNEDEPGWDCRTMGNKICGPTSN